MDHFAETVLFEDSEIKNTNPSPVRRMKEILNGFYTSHF